MKRALIATLISGALALSMTLPPAVLGTEWGPVPVPVPLPDAATIDASRCASVDGVVVARGGCCQRNGGICGCRNGQARCCDGRPGVGCSCQGDSTPPEEL
jgi:hypothetical protein